MSRYTTELQNIILSEFDLGMDLYPIFSEEYRASLNAKIFSHYYFHEIGFETVSRFKHYLNATMNEIMPYYNQLFQSQLLAINPLLTFERKVNSTKDVGSTNVEDLSNTTVKTLDNITNQSTNTTIALDSTNTKTVVDTTAIDGTTTQTENIIKGVDNTTNQTTGVIKASDTVDHQTSHNVASVDTASNIDTDDSVIVDQDATQNTTIASTKTNDGANTVNDKDIFSDTPKAILSVEDINTNLYASNARIKTNAVVVDESEVLASTEGITKTDNSTTTTTTGVVATGTNVSDSLTTNDSTNAIDEMVNTTDLTVLVSDETVDTTNSVIVSNDSTTNVSDTTVVGSDETNVMTGNVIVAVDETETNNADNTRTQTLNEVNVVTENGFEIPLSDLLLKYRETFLNIDMLIIKELKDLFLMIY